MVRSRHKVDAPLDSPFATPRGHIRAGATPKKPIGVLNTFRVVVRGNRLSEVRVNGEPLPALLEGVPHSPEGAFGLWVDRSECVLSNPTFNDNKVPLLVDPSPKVPERP